MALGDNGNNKNDFRTTLYSMIKFDNPESSVEASRLSFSFWKGMLIWDIAPMIPKKSEDEIPDYDYKQSSRFYFSTQLALQLYKEIGTLLDPNNSIENISIKTRSGSVLKIYRGTEHGTNNFCMVFEKVLADKSFEIGHLFEFNDFYYSLQNLNENDFSFDKNYHKTIEIEILQHILLEYVKSMTGAQAYANLDYGRFEINKLKGNINAIATGVGVDLYNKSGNYNKNKYRNNTDPFESSDTGDSSTSYNDFESEMEEPF